MASRIASFHLQTIKDVNHFVDLATLPPDAEFKDQVDASWAAANRPTQQHVAQQLFAAGRQQRSDVERGLPHRVTRFPYRPGSEQLGETFAEQSAPTPEPGRAHERESQLPSWLLGDMSGQVTCRRRPRPWDGRPLLAGFGPDRGSHDELRFPWRTVMPYVAAQVVGFAVAAIGLPYGANAGYAINPARVLGPRVFAWATGWGGTRFTGHSTRFLPRLLLGAPRRTPPRRRDRSPGRPPHR
ncbi:hypothetical protein AB0D38_22285 [Streptomyces sp. NPDC048279]|uniref:hypothetical protein n=1 Tax=Streptomyces sp. NPDC048279 TaxID=3154714 RepID=UPI00341BD66B